jgi:inositol-polyphosphate multikinase
MSDADGTLFIKPCTQAELDFYNLANRRFSDFADLMPLYIGTLMLSDPADLSSIEEGVPGPIALAAEAAAQASASTAPDYVHGVTWVQNKTKKIQTDQAVVLESASHGFHQPNILDAKLGVRLWADDAPLEKKKRFDKITSQTTHRDFGFRIAGMRVYRGSDDPSELNDDEYKIYDKDYGRVSVSNDNIVSTLRRFIFNDAAGIDADLGQAIAQAFVRDLKRVEKVLASHESRMYSASVLFVFEGDGEKLREAIEENNRIISDPTTEKGEKPGRSNIRVDSGIELMDDEDEEDDGPTIPKIYTIKLIDFAHARFTPGLGPDENSLTGVRSLIRIFEELSA